MNIPIARNATGTATPTMIAVLFFDPPPPLLELSPDPPGPCVAVELPPVLDAVATVPETVFVGELHGEDAMESSYSAL